MQYPHDGDDVYVLWVECLCIALSGANVPHLIAVLRLRNHPLSKLLQLESVTQAITSSILRFHTLCMPA